MTETVEVTEDGIWLSATARVFHDGEPFEVRRENWATEPGKPHVTITWRVAGWGTTRPR